MLDVSGPLLGPLRIRASHSDNDSDMIELRILSPRQQVLDGGFLYRWAQPKVIIKHSFEFDDTIQEYEATRNKSQPLRHQVPVSLRAQSEEPQKTGVIHRWPLAYSHARAAHRRA